MRTKTILLCGTATMLANLASSGFAQTSVIEEVIVTSRKQEERLQEVPLAITAFSSEQISRHQIADLGDVAKLTPGLNFEAYTGGSKTPVIRGAAQQRITDLDQNVSTFFDGIYLPRQYVVSQGTFGLERVEVVKGPQSALYGRNAFMGAINYISKKPGDTWHGEGSGTVGVYKRYDVQADASGPIVPDRLFVRVGAGYSTFDGDQINSHPNANVDINPGSPGRLGGWEHKTYQGRIVAKPSDTVELDFGVYRFENNDESPGLIRVMRTTGDTNCGNRTGGARLFCGALPYAFTPVPGSASQPADADIDPRSIGLKSTTTIMRGHAEWKPVDTLAIVYEYGNIESNAISGGASDRDPLVGSLNILAPTAPRASQFTVSPAGNVRYWSHELRASYSPGAGLDFLVGGIYSKVKDLDFLAIGPALPLLGTTPFDVNSSAFIKLTNGRTSVVTKSVFGRINWQATDALRLGVEARYSSENKALVNGPTAFNPVVANYTGKWNQFTPRATVDYKVTQQNLLYASAARGAKAGGLNLAAFLPSQSTFDSDTNWTYEIGSKNELMDGRLRLNGALFYIDWNNRQVSCSAQGAPVGALAPAVICNVGSASVKGFEIETVLVPVDGLTLNAGASYNDAKYKNGVIDQRIRDFQLCDNVVCPTSGDVSGKQLERQSKFQMNLGGEYSVPIGQVAGFLGLDASYKSKQYAESVNLAWLPSRWLLDARTGVRADAWDLTLWVKNLTNKKYAMSAFAIFSATESSYLPVKGPGRTAGLTGRYHF